MTVSAYLSPKCPAIHEAVDGSDDDDDDDDGLLGEVIKEAKEDDDAELSNVSVLIE
jgi:hypothetical protein